MASADVFPLVNLFVDAVQKLWPIVLPFIIVCIYIWSWHRAGSAFFINQRFFALLGANKTFSDNTLETRWNSLRDFYKFNLKFGVKFPSISIRDEFLAWVDNSNVGLEEILRVKNYISLNPIGIKNPNIELKQWEVFFQSILAAIPLLFSLIFISSDHAFLTVKKTGTFFWVKEGNAYSWNKGSWAIDNNKCASIIPVLNDNYDKEVICSLVKGEKKEFINDAVSSQKKTGGIVSALFGIFLICIINSMRKALLADYLYRKIKNNPVQLKFKFGGFQI